MKEYLKWLWSTDAIDNTSNPGYIYKRIVTWVTAVTLIIIIFLLFLVPCNRITAILTFLGVAGACAAGGAAIGFLFGLPRAEKYRFIKKDDVDHNTKDYSYADNTNLEEVSDWLTKIIVGLSLVKFRTILEWLHTSANSIKLSFSCAGTGLNMYVFGYSVMILYFLAGAGLCYLWARTNLSLILTRSKKLQEEIQKTQLLKAASRHVNASLLHSFEQLSTDKGIIETNSLPRLNNFKQQIEKIYNSEKKDNPDDPQKQRWGGLAEVGNKLMEASYDPVRDVDGFWGIKLTIRSLDPENPLTGLTAFFLHPTFPAEIVYVRAENNLVTLSLVAYEAFVAGARLEDGTELELDLNKVTGFPQKFYYKN